MWSGFRSFISGSFHALHPSTKQMQKVIVTSPSTSVSHLSTPSPVSSTAQNRPTTTCSPSVEKKHFLNETMCLDLKWLQAAVKMLRLAVIQWPSWVRVPQAVSSAGHSTNVSSEGSSRVSWHMRASPDHEKEADHFIGVDQEASGIYWVVERSDGGWGAIEFDFLLQWLWN